MLTVSLGMLVMVRIPLNRAFLLSGTPLFDEFPSVLPAYFPEFCFVFSSVEEEIFASKHLYTPSLRCNLLDGLFSVWL